MHRLKTRPQFQAVLAGQMLAKTTHFALHCCAVEGSPVAKRAVTRSAIKRQIYQVGLGNESVLLERAHLVRLRSAFDRKHFVSASSDALKSAVRQELQQLFARAQASCVTPASALKTVGATQ
mgnify:CR=1 FL=1